MLGSGLHFRVKVGDTQERGWELWLQMKKVGKGLSFFLTFKVFKYGLKFIVSNVISQSEIRYDIKETQKCADILFVL